MNTNGNPGSLRAAQPGNLNASKMGVYSARARAARVAELRAAADGIPTFALAVAAVRDERSRLDQLRAALDANIAEHGLSTRSGAAREQFTRRSSVIRQLDRLDVNWAMGGLVDGAEVDEGLEEDPAAGVLRDQLLGLLALRDLLELDLEHYGVSTRKGGLRGQVAQRVGVSRELVRLADRIRTATRRARSALVPLRAWDVAREIAFDPSQRPGDAITAIRYLLTQPAPPPMKSPELVECEAEVDAMSEEELDAALAELMASELETHRDLDEAARIATNEKPSTDLDALPAQCLVILQRDRRWGRPARDRARSHACRETPGAPSGAHRCGPGVAGAGVVDGGGTRPRPPRSSAPARRRPVLTGFGSEAVSYASGERQGPGTSAPTRA